MKQSRIVYNLSGLEDLKRQLRDSYITRVGVLGEKAERNDGGPMNNAEIGVLQQFGSISQKIPPRDFLIMPIEVNRREITKSLGGAAARAAIDRKDYKRMFVLLGVKALQFVDMTFQTRGFGQWAPNAPATIARKGSSAPLIDTGQLRRAIDFDVVKKGSVNSISTVTA